MTQSWDAQNYARHFSFVPEYGRQLIEILAPQKGETILDLGCGTGVLTSEIAARGCNVTGVDGDANMIALAKKAYPAIDFQQQDAHRLNFDAKFDAAFSNAALHWMKIGDVFPQVAKALKKGGRFAAEMGGIHNIAAIETAIYKALAQHGVTKTAAPAAWYFPTPSEAAQKLEQAGFEVRFMHLFDRPVTLTAESGGLKGWVKMFGGALLGKVPEAQHETLLQKIEDEARAMLFYDNEWHADYRRFHFVAVKL